MIKSCKMYGNLIQSKKSEVSFTKSKVLQVQDPTQPQPRQVTAF